MFECVISAGGLGVGKPALTSEQNGTSVKWLFSFDKSNDTEVAL